MKIRPFDAGGWFPIHNAVFDIIMPNLSPSAWKILCVAIRQTWGWVADPNGDPKVRKLSDIISYSQFAEKAGQGLVSYSTINKGIQECMGKKYLLRVAVSKGTGIAKMRFAYRLNTEYELLTEAAPATESVAAPATESVAAPATESVDTKQKKQTNKCDDDDVQQQSTHLLTQFGISESVATELSVCKPDHIQAWLDYITSRNLTSPHGFLVSRLRLGEWPPQQQLSNPDARAHRQRYIGGKYADYIEH